ncbi:MAG: TRAP transporter small permease [Pseudorhodoplanes sp.]|nr:TRAP transporter small permease [Pseudorhodoplanes sp.]
MSGPSIESNEPARGALAAITRPLAVAGGFVLVVVSAVVTVNVVLRWLFTSAVPGDIELVQIGTALAVFSFLPLCQSRRGNIMVDTFTTWLSPAAQRGLDALWDIVYALMAAIIAWRLGIGAYDTIRSNTVSMMLGLPTGWAIAACAAMAALLALVAVATAVRLMRSSR